MANIHTVFNACLYAFILVFFIVFSTLGCFLFHKYITRTKIITDVEANTTRVTDEKRKSLCLLTLPAKFYLDPVVYPSAARSAKRLPSYHRIISNPFRTHSGDKCPLVIDTATIEADEPKIGDSGSNRIGSNHADDEQPYTGPFPPSRPPRPSLLDDLLAGFLYEHDVARFPLNNPKTRCWELSVVWGTRPVSRYVPRDGKGGRVDSVPALKQEEEKSVFSIDGEEIDNTPLTPSNTIVAIEKSSKSKKRDERNKKKKNGRPIVPVFEIPELHVNARPYEEIEAEEEERTATEVMR